MACQLIPARPGSLLSLEEETFFAPRPFGKTLQNSMSDKYPEMILNSRLTWKEHMDVKVKKVQNSMWACRKVCVVTWGLKPWVIHWLYVPIIRPSVTFAYLMRWPGCQTASAKKIVRNFQDLGIEGAMRTTPTNARRHEPLPLHMQVVQVPRVSSDHSRRGCV